MTIDPRTIEACAQLAEQKIGNFWDRQETVAAIRALASGVDYFSNDPMGVEIDFPDYAPAGTALTAEERQIVDDAKSQPHLYATVQTVRNLTGIVDRLTTPCPAEVSEDELAAILGNVIRERHGLKPLSADEIVWESDWDIHRQQARALLAQYDIRRRA